MAAVAEPPPPLTALVTGASGGIGAAVARRLAETGYHLTLSGRDETRLRQVVRELEPYGVALQPVVADMADEELVRRVAREHHARYGSLDLLVVCAGVGSAAPVAGYPLKRLDRQLAVNVRAPFLLVGECLPALRVAAAARPERGARVVAVSSMTAVAAEPGLSAYAASKAALNALCQSVNVEESAHGVSATAICPGYVDTDMSAWKHGQIDPAEMIGVADVVELILVTARLSARAVVPQIMVTRRGNVSWRA